MCAPSNTVDVWWIDLDAERAGASAAFRLLSDSERDHARRLRVTDAWTTFVLTRATLRRLLSAYVGRPVDAIQLAFEPNGKPFLPGSDVYFNVSHSGTMAVVALSGRGPIGVDVEWHDRRVDLLGVADRFFAATEVQKLHDLPAHRLERGFYACWTRKEAYIKALGTGLSYDLASFSVTLTPEEPVTFCGAERETWELAALAVEAGYSAALVAPRSATELTVRQFRWGKDAPRSVAAGWVEELLSAMGPLPAASTSGSAR